MANESKINELEARMKELEVKLGDRMVAEMVKMLVRFALGLSSILMSTGLFFSGLVQLLRYVSGH